MILCDINIITVCDKNYLFLCVLIQSLPNPWGHQHYFYVGQKGERIVFRGRAKPSKSHQLYQSVWKLAGFFLLVSLKSGGGGGGKGKIILPWSQMPP